MSKIIFYLKGIGNPWSNSRWTLDIVPRRASIWTTNLQEAILPFCIFELLLRFHFKKKKNPLFTIHHFSLATVRLVSLKMSPITSPGAWFQPDLPNIQVFKCSLKFVWFIKNNFWKIIYKNLFIKKYFMKKKRKEK